MNGSVFKRCGCVDERGRPVSTCPELRRPGHGSWALRLDLGPGPGPDGEPRLRRQRYKSGFATKRAAEAAAAALVASVSSGSHVEPSRVTVGTYLQQWLDGKVRLRPTSRESYRLYIERYFVPHLGHLELRQLKTIDIERMYAQVRLGSGKGVKRKQPVSASTITRLHAVLRAALNTAVKRKLLAHNPALGVELEPAQRPAVTPYEVEELGRLLDEAGRHRLGPLLELMALTGLRRGEAVGLRWQDVDLERGRLTVRQQIVRSRGRLVVGPPKTRNSEDRRVDLDQGTIGALLAHRLQQLEERRRSGLAEPSHDLVFTDELGAGYSPDYVSRQFKWIAARAGLPVKRLHDLRHGSASLQQAAGVALAVVSKRLGHSTVALTADTYSHLLEGVGRDAAERAAALVPRSRLQSGAEPVHKSCTSADPLVADDDCGPAPEGEDPQVTAEAGRFELPMGLKSQTALAVRRHRPD